MPPPILASIRNAAVVIPTYKAEPFFVPLSTALSRQGIAPDRILVIDSSSPDRTASLFRGFGARVVVIPQSEFNHGGTRQRAAELMSDFEYLIYLTQDAIPLGDQAFARIICAFVDPSIGMAYGRQMARPGASAIERHARERNYPNVDLEIRSFADRSRMGVKTTFCSDSFAAYRRSALMAVGGFPEDAFFAEDQITAGRMLMANWKLAYAGNACVIHSHAYSVVDDFKRCFDIGVYHARNSWLLKAFGRAEGEGFRFVVSELRYLLQHEPWSIPSAAIRTLAKYAGYRFGRAEQRWSLQWKARLSMAPAYWKAARLP